MEFKKDTDAFKRCYSDGINLMLSAGFLAVLTFMGVCYIKDSYHKNTTQNHTERAKEGDLPKITNEGR